LSNAMIRCVSCVIIAVSSANIAKFKWHIICVQSGNNRGELKFCGRPLLIGRHEMFLNVIGRKRTKIKDRSRATASSASAQNEWQRGTEANMRKKPKLGEGRGNKRRQSQPGRDVGGAKHETGETARTTNDTDESHGRKQELQRREQGNQGTKQD
ncbi:hypothetical protein TNCV_1465771, partial [Trichonephila clavipes]